MNQSYLVHLSHSDLESLIANTIRAELSQLLPPREDPEPNQDDLLKVPEIQRMFGVCKQTVLSWSKSGKLPTIRVGGRIYFPKAEVLKVLKSRMGRNAL
jgi:predicted DNA-binding transcriptional regulator AlpA